MFNKNDEEDERHADDGADAHQQARTTFEIVVTALISLVVLAVGLFFSGTMLVAVGLSATGVSVGGGAILVCVPLPVIIALVLIALLWRRR